MSLHYHLVPTDPAGHYFDVTLTIARPDSAGQVLWLPVWIPGSYLIREFARHIVTIEASSDGKPIEIAKLDKHRWRAAPTRKPLVVTYRVYAFDLSVRGAYLDETRGFFNGTSVFLAVAGQETQPCTVELSPPAGRARWRVATSLNTDGARPGAFGRYRAADYDELIDHPVEMGEFARESFTVAGVPHEIVIAGRQRADLKRLKRDLKKICEYQIGLFGAPAPFSRYVFMTMVTGDGYGGLEHRASTALLASRDDLPLAHETGIKPGYRQYLGLCSHEYFHSWNVKRIKPAAFAPYDLQRENYTRLLWAFEGITSYYDDLTLVRTGLIPVQEYLDLLAQTMTQVERGPGRLKQTLEEASLDAWIKYYRQDENSPNAQVSYYTKGALAALCLDLTLRSRTAGARSLDDVMRVLWQRYGHDFETRGEGVPEADWEQLASEVAGLDLAAFFEQALRTTEPLPLARLLAEVGVESQLRPIAGATDKGGWQEIRAPGNTLGARTAAEAGGVKLTHVFDGGPAQAAGLAAGDVLVAIEGLRVTSGNLEGQLAAWPAGTTLKVHAFRRDELCERQLTLLPAPTDTWGLRPDQHADAARLAQRRAWLGRD
ncbi:PDZ domain-containing protein [Chitiniphilus purpureus]|uniref:PDZ domain-containing protein n=1 Tax=Chitiniphilus purpureus TaxID=2981137 RepID=A0ABY6DIM9_9NEIS|nr:PDZ domain-containing protein [Chitiniphilus sp. CD1]UXY14200.1 PDZ domain-containing protein [Chitiniphilus sp. CD1]